MLLSLLSSIVALLASALLLASLCLVECYRDFSVSDLQGYESCEHMHPSVFEALKIRKDRMGQQVSHIHYLMSVGSLCL
jgi:hypothetical protein